MFSKFFRPSYRLVNQNIASQLVKTPLRQFSAANNHEVLRVKKTATLKEIKEAYRKLALIYHPDHGGNPKDFCQLVNSYRELIEKKETVSHSSSQDSQSQEKKQSYYDKNNNNSAFSNINSFYDLEKLLVKEFNISSTNYLKQLKKLGLKQEKLCSILNESSDIALLITNVAESDRENLIDLIGRDHIAKVLNLHDLFERDFTCNSLRTNSKTIFNRHILPWKEYEKLFKILRHDTVLKCLKSIKFLLSSIRMSFHTEEIDSFFDYLGKEALNKYISTHEYSLNNILKEVSIKKQEELLNYLEPSYFELKYTYLFDITSTLKALHPSNHSLFMNIIGKNKLDYLMKDPTMDHRHIEHFESILNEQEKEADKHHPRFKR